MSKVIVRDRRPDTQAGPGGRRRPSYGEGIMRTSVAYRMVFGLGLLVAAAPAARAAELHFIAFCDTLDPAIGTVDDLNNAQAWAEAIASATGLTLRFDSLSGSDLTVTKAQELLDGLAVSPNDVVYFYYSGHGGNPGNLTWPVLMFLSVVYPESYDDYLSFDDVVAMLRPKNPRLLVVMADCCNNYPEQAQPKPPARPTSGPAVTAAFRALFVESAGTVLASGASPGQFSYGGQGAGGMFTNTFLESFYSLAPSSGSSLTWESVLSTARADTAAAAQSFGETQEPQYAIRGEVVNPPSDEDPSDPNGPSDGSDEVIDMTPLAAPLCGMMDSVALAGLAMGLTLARVRRRWE
jgi:hypothetical protein